MLTGDIDIPDTFCSKVHGANMGPIWGRQDPGGPHVRCYLGYHARHTGAVAEGWSRWLPNLVGCTGGCLGDNRRYDRRLWIGQSAFSLESVDWRTWLFRPPNWRYSPIYIAMRLFWRHDFMILLSPHVSLYAFHQSYPSDNNACIKCLYLLLYYDVYAHKGLVILVILFFSCFVLDTNIYIYIYVYVAV